MGSFRNVVSIRDVESSLGGANRYDCVIVCICLTGPPTHIYIFKNDYDRKLYVVCIYLTMRVVLVFLKEILFQRKFLNLLSDVTGTL